MPRLNYSDTIDQNMKDKPTIEHMLGYGLLAPFSPSISGARQILFSNQRGHVFPLINPEKAILETGYEIRFGDYSSSVTKADSDYTVIAKISKFSFAPNHHYWLIIKDNKRSYLDVVERISYHYITESYGFLYNNEYMDSLQIGDVIRDNTVIQKSLAFDEYNNRRDGVNFNVTYMALDDTLEDAIILSDKAASRMASALVKPVEIMINDNDIPLNIYGDDNVYKVIPDIGEEIIDANLIALRKEKKEEAYYTQSVNRLRDIMISDDKKQVKGRVIDINIYCNNPDILDSYYYSQLKMYYNELQRQSAEFVQFLTPLAAQKYEFSYQLQKLFANAKRVMNRDMYMDKRSFSNILLEIDVLEEKQMEAGDKMSNRYGGKGVCSDIWPQEYMPRFKNAKGEYEYVDLIFNSSTMVNRENPAQNFEISLNHIGSEIINHIISEKLELDDAYSLIHKFINMCSPQQAAYMEEKKQTMSREDLMFFIENIIGSGSIQLSIRPYVDKMTIDKIREIYKEFPFVKQNKVEVAMVGSNGQIRHIPTRRNMVIGKQYIYRLKQYAEEKFSATSLSATNIRNENTKSRVKKDFRELYSNTPIRFGNMESQNMQHLNVEVLITNMMIHSLSPQGRRLVEQMYTGDPFKIDIKLDSDSKNRSAEIANTYLKTIGRRLVFLKKPKVRKGIAICPVLFEKAPFRKAVEFVPEDMREGFDYEKDFQERKAFEEEKKKAGAKPAVLFYGRSLKRWDEEETIEGK